MCRYDTNISCLPILAYCMNIYLNMLPNWAQKEQYVCRYSVVTFV